MLFTAVFLFGACSALLNMGAKMTPAGHWRAYKRRGDGVEYIGGMGKRKPAPGKPRTGAGDLQDFFAVSQITINGRRIINRTIKRGSPPFSGGRVKSG